MSVRISVIMAVYNGERYLEQALLSVLNQNITDLEFIVVDDGSTDRTRDILATISKKDRRLRVIHQERLGQTASLNHAASLATGEYLARQDADDISLAGRMEQQISYLESHPRVGALGCATQIIDAQGRILGCFPTQHGPRAVKRALRTVRATLVHGSVMMRRVAFESLGGYREAFRVAQDFDLWLRMTMTKWDLDNLPQVLFHWRLSPGGVHITQWESQLRYGGIALAFLHECKRFGKDSCALLESSRGDWDAFSSGYRLRGLLHGLWGELFLRGLRDPLRARTHLQQAIRNGFLHPRTLFFWGWSIIGARWPGSRPLALSEQP